MPQPSIIGMEPPFGDAFQNYSLADQALTSTDLLNSSSDPDFMYELDRDMCHRQSPCGDSSLGMGDGGKDGEGCMDQLMGLGECEAVNSSSVFEQWDTYWEDLTRYTRLASCDIWGTKEVDFLGLDDFSSPYQDEEVIGQTPTLAQLNSEDSQPVCEALYHPAEAAMSAPQLHSSSYHTKRPPGLAVGAGASAKRLSLATPSSSRASCSLLADFPEGSQKATWPVPSSTETMSKTQSRLTLTQDYGPTQPKIKGPGNKMAAPPASSHGALFVRKAKVRVSTPFRAPAAGTRVAPEFKGPSPPRSLPQPQEKASTSASTPLVAAPGTAAGGFERRAEALARKEMSATMPQLVGASQPLEGSSSELPGGSVSTAALAGAASGLVAEGADKSKEEEHNYSLFLARARRLPQGQEEDEDQEEDEEEEEEEDDDEEEEEEDEDEDDEDEEPEDVEAEGMELDDEDHDEGFGSEHELSENEDDDYEADKDDDMSDSFSEPGFDVEPADGVKGVTAAGVSSRKRGKRRYFWEYSEQLTPSKQERMLKPSEWDRHTLPSNLYQKNGPLHGKYKLKKSRRTDVEDLTPNPRKLLQIGTELRKLNKVISDLTPVSELPLTARPRSRKEKNKLASRACRLKKKAQYEANKVKLWGLSTEYDRLLFVINAIKEEIVTRVKESPQPNKMADTLDRLIQETLVSSPVAGQTSDFVNQILENTGHGDPTGGLVGLRVPTSKI